MKARLMVLALVGLVATGCATRVKEDADKSWTHARVFVPGRWTSTSVGGVKVDRPLPVVLLFHGCGGIHQTEMLWAGFLKEQGFVTVLPDSFARSRPQSCDPRTYRGRMFPGVTMFRSDEVDYALERLQEAPWADKSNLFLMGHSEGGRLVAEFRFEGIRGVIISGWNCGNNALNVAPKAAVLAIEHERDPWFPNSLLHCSDSFRTRTNAREIRLPGSGHDTFKPLAREAVAEFLNSNLAK